MPNYTIDSRYAHSGTGNTSTSGNFLGFFEQKIILPAEDDVLFIITHEFENRPDLIANKFFSNSQLMWVILVRNDIVNPLTDLYVGRTISIPSNTRLRSEILS